MEDDGEQTVLALDRCRNVFKDCISAHNGREFGSVGDSLMAEFSSPIEALRAAIQVQARLRALNREAGSSRYLRFRIGINAGDVIAETDDLYGDVVNVAARLQQMAKVGGITMSALVYEQVLKESNCRFRYLGRHYVKNIAEPVRVYEVVHSGSMINWHRARLLAGRYAPAASGALVVAVIALAYLWYHEASVPHIGDPIYVPAETAADIQHADPRTNRVGLHSIAVPPFINLSGEETLNAVAEKAAARVSDMLRQSPSFSVVSLDELPNRDVYEGQSSITPNPGAHFLVLGSVDEAAGNVRITLRLVDAVDGRQVWQCVIDRAAGETAEIPMQTAQLVSRALASGSVDLH